MPNLVKNLLLPLVVIGMAAALAFVMVASREQLPKREQAAVAPFVETMTVRRGLETVRVQSRGVVSPRRSLDLVSEVSGRVVWVDPGFLRGEEIAGGQLLLKIDPVDYEVAVSDAQAAVASAELSLAEVEVVVRRAAIDEAEARLRAARDRLRQARQNLANTEIRAPFDAVVDLKQVDLGQYVLTGSALTRLLSTEVAEVRLPILASDLPFVRYGQSERGDWPEVTLTASFGNTRYTWRARLARLEQRVDAQTRVFYLVAEVDRPYDRSLHDHILALGLFVEADFEGVAIPDAVRLPRSALHGGNVVYVVEDGRLLRREVTLYRREGDSVIVGEGLTDGARVVLSRLGLMVDGMPVRTGEA